MDIAPLPRVEQISAKKSHRDKVLSLAKMGTWRWTVGQSHIEFSETLYTIFNVNPSLFDARLSSLRDLISPRDMAKLFLNFNRMLHSGGDTVTILRMAQPGGDDTYHIKCYASCETSKKGHITAIYGLIQDVTIEREQQDRLEDALLKAEEANRSKAGFLATMSHELRTPLNAIIGFSEMMQAELLGPLGNQRYGDYVNCIHESGRHLLELINDILDMSKIDSGKYELFHESVNVTKSLRLACHMMEAPLADKNIELAIDAPDDLPVIEADRRAFMQVILNILSNAVKFTRNHGQISVIASVSNHGDELAICITDTGIGIPADKIDSVTRPFEQVSNAMTRQHQGTGLGLAITKKLIEFHNGQLRIDSEVGRGTAVTIILPVVIPQKQFDLFRPAK